MADPTVLQPNKKSMETITRQRSEESRIAREQQLIEQAKWRGETVEDRVRAITDEDRRAERVAAEKIRVFELYGDLADEFGLSLDELYEARREAAKGYNARIAFRDFLIRERNRTSPDTSRSSSEDRPETDGPTFQPISPLSSAATRGFSAIRRLIRTCFP